MAGGRVEEIIKQRILASVYWKKECFGVNAATICDRAADLTAVGGLFGNQRPLPFLCLVYKLLLIAPPREIVEEMLHQPYFKYLTALAAVIIRLSYDAITVHVLLEPLLADYRKLRRITPSGDAKLWHMDELIDELLTTERIFGLALPRMPSRLRLEDAGLAPRPDLLKEWAPNEQCN